MGEKWTVPHVLYLSMAQEHCYYASLWPFLRTNNQAGAGIAHTKTPWMYHTYIALLKRRSSSQDGIAIPRAF